MEGFRATGGRVREKQWEFTAAVLFCPVLPSPLQAADEPAYLTVGTDVSAKYRGAFCEAKIKTVKRLVKVKVINMFLFLSLNTIVL